MPSGLKRLWEAMPRPIQSLIAMTVDRILGHPVPSPPGAPTDAAVRVLIGPVNWAGQGYRWARAIEQNPTIAARNLISAEIDTFGYDFDYGVRWRTMTHSRRWQREALERVIRDFTHVLFEAQMPLLGGLFKEDTRRQVEALRAGGVSVGMICHGTDIRLPSRSAHRERWSPYLGDDWVPVPPLEELALRNRQLLDDLQAPTFVSTPGLLLDVPYAHVLPVVIDPTLWVTGAPALRQTRLRVLHVPSNPVPKGTLLIEPTLRRLHDEGVIEHITVPFGAEHSAMPALIASADVVLDQFRIGDYGVGACEAMMAGRLVVSHVSDQARAAVLDADGIELPIVEATVDSLESVLRSVANHPESYREAAARGPEFVSLVHDGRKSREVLERHFLFA